jgi:hypothetical protein
MNLKYGLKPMDSSLQVTNLEMYMVQGSGGNSPLLRQLMEGILHGDVQQGS